MSKEFDIACSHKSNVIEKFLTTNPIFVCVISYTETSQIPGITFAGANPDLIKYTPAADSEFLYHGKCFSISGVPATPDGIPTPALLTRMMRSAGYFFKISAAKFSICSGFETSST